MWLYPGTNWTDPAYQFSQEKFQDQRIELQTKLYELMERYY